MNGERSMLCWLSPDDKGLDQWENLFSGFANKKGVDQPAHLPRQISAFDIRLLESIISKLATSKIQIFKLASQNTGLILALSETLETIFCRVTAHIKDVNLM